MKTIEEWVSIYLDDPNALLGDVLEDFQAECRAEAFAAAIEAVQAEHDRDVKQYAKWGDCEVGCAGAIKAIEQLAQEK